MFPDDSSSLTQPLSSYSYVIIVKMEGETEYSGNNYDSNNYPPVLSEEIRINQEETVRGSSGTLKSQRFF